MAPSATSILPNLPQLLALAIAVTAALIAVGAYLLRHRPSALAGMHRQPISVKPKEGIIYRDAPTVRVYMEIGRASCRERV